MLEFRMTFDGNHIAGLQSVGFVEKDFEEPRCVVKKYSPVWIDGNDLSHYFKGSVLCKLCVRKRQRFRV